MTARPIRVLLLEDSDADARRVKAWLGGGVNGACEVEHATCLGAALAHLRRDEFDVVLLDLCVPDSEGIDTLQRAREVDPTVPIVVQSGIEEEAIAIDALSLGAQDYLLKRELTSRGLRRSIRYAIERARSEAALRESEERYKLAVEGANDGIWDWDLRTGRIWFGPRWKAILGLGDRAISDRPRDWFELVHPEDVAGLAAAINEHIAGTSPHFQHEHRMRHGDGSWRWMLSRGLARRDGSGVAYRVAGSTTDITARKKAEHRLMRLALYDDLTGLASRALFVSLLTQVVERHRRDPAHRFAVLFVDLDRFKLVNDSLGHLAGDELLVAVARRLVQCVRPSDTVSRLGGDEFAVLLDGLADPIAARVAADRIHDALGLPVSVRGQELFTSASIGIARGDGRDTPEELLRRADLAMYRAKREGRARSHQFREQLDADRRLELHLETDLRRAIDQGEFLVHYQPIVDLANGTITGFEALARWRSQDRGLVGPEDFIPFAEERGLIGELGLTLFQRACRDARELELLCSPLTPMRVAINLSGRQFADPDLFDQLLAIVRSAHLDPSSLTLELTETALLDNAETAATTLDRLRDLGMRIHLDDFGTGFSSLAWLQRFPIDSLKIDRSFVGRLGRDADDQAIVGAIVGLARSLGKGVVAEGIETAEQASRLREMGCELGQGFFYSQPVDLSAARGMVGASFGRIEAIRA